MIIVCTAHFVPRELTSEIEVCLQRFISVMDILYSQSPGSDFKGFKPDHFVFGLFSTILPLMAKSREGTTGKNQCAYW